MKYEIKLSELTNEFGNMREFYPQLWFSTLSMKALTLFMPLLKECSNR